MKIKERTQEVEGELEQLREDAENAQFNIEQFGLDSYTPRQLHEWKESFEEGLIQVKRYSEEYRQISNDNSITGINARQAVTSCIDYLTQEMCSRGGRK